MGTWTGRTVVYEAACQEVVDRLRVDYERLDEALAGVEWALSNSPERFPELYGSSLRMARTFKVSEVPELRIWFVFDDSTATVIFVEPSQDDEED